MPPIQRAHPPSAGAGHVLVHHCDDVSSPEGQLVGTLGRVVVQSFGKFVLQNPTEMSLY